MNTRQSWQTIAERLADAGWSWQHRKVEDRDRRSVHLVSAHVEGGERHAVAADAIAPAFAALKESIKAAGHKE